MLIQGTIIVPPPPAKTALDAEFARVQHRLLEVAARWAQVNIAGLSREAAHRVIDVEIERLKAFANARESGL